LDWAGLYGPTPLLNGKKYFWVDKCLAQGESQRTDNIRVLLSCSPLSLHFPWAPLPLCFCMGASVTASSFSQGHWCRCLFVFTWVPLPIPLRFSMVATALLKKPFMAIRVRKRALIGMHLLQPRSSNKTKHMRVFSNWVMQHHPVWSETRIHDSSCVSC